MSDLTDFLSARLDYDEADIRQARIDDMPEWWSPDCWTRERALADIEAKRRIVAEFDGLTFESPGGAWEPYRTVMRDVLRILAAVYADHPAYRQEWKP